MQPTNQSSTPQHTRLEPTPPSNYPKEVQDAYHTLWNSLIDKPRKSAPDLTRGSINDLLKRCGRASTTPQGQPEISLPDRSLLQANLLEVARSNLFQEHLFEPRLHEQLFIAPQMVLRPEQVLIAAYSLAGGFGATPNSQRMILPLLALPLQAQTVDIVVARNREWAPARAEFLQPLRTSKSGALVPLVGGVFYNRQNMFARTGEEASPGDDILNTSAFKRSAEARPEEDPILGQYPMYIRGGRSLLLPTSYEIPLLATETGGFRLPETIEEMEMLRDDTVPRLEVVAMQYVGVGLSKYQYHTTRCHESGLVDLDKDEVALKIPGGSIEGGRTRFAHNTSYADKAGIFLDIRHQPHTIAPTGGMVRGERVLKHEGLLLAHGAKLGAVTVGYVPLITKDDVKRVFGEVDKMPCGQVEVHAKAVIGTTFRLPAAHMAAQHSLKTFTTCMAQMMDVPEAEIIPAYLRRLFTTVGHNIKICARLGFTVNRYENTFDDLNVFGEICDAENLKESKTPYELVHLVSSWLSDLFDVAKAFPGQTRAQICNELLPQFVSSMGLSERSVPSSLQRSQQEDDDLLIKLLTITCTSRIVAESLRAHNSIPDLSTLLDSYDSDPVMRASLEEDGIFNPRVLVDQITSGSAHCLSGPVGSKEAYYGEEGVSRLREMLLDRFLMSKCLTELTPSITDEVSRRKRRERHIPAPLPASLDALLSPRVATTKPLLQKAQEFEITFPNRVKPLTEKQRQQALRQAMAKRRKGGK